MILQGSFMERHVRILVSGKVQGVFFRDYTCRKASSLFLTGEVRNFQTGDVEIDAQGEISKIDELIQWCSEGSPMSIVEAVHIDDLPVGASFTRFSIDYESSF